MKPQELRGKRVLVMGLGLHGGGLGVTRWLLRQGAQVTVTDLKTAEQLAPTLQALEGEKVRLVLGEHREEDFLSADLIVRNPGVPRESRWLQLARAHGVPVEMEMGLFMTRLPLGAAQVVGVTGTKGKTTTTLMVGAILQAVNPRTVVAGNLRVSALELLERIGVETPVVLELSSWQLEAFTPHRLSPRYAAIINLYEDHLNRYRDMQDYAQAKAEIFRYQQPEDWLVLNLDSPDLTWLRRQSLGRVIWFSSRRALKEGAYLEGETLVWKMDGKLERVLQTRDLNLPGRHNVENALAAMAVARVWGAEAETIRSTLSQFRGAPHRLEWVAKIRGVDYINDTTATAPAATLAALEAVGPTARGIVLIAGGADKGMVYDTLAQGIAARNVQVLLLEGTATAKIRGALERAQAGGRILGQFDSLGQALLRAREVAREGEVVLLSPGCASFGMFANEFERGDEFRRIVGGWG